jgi:hypothetical protein
VVVKIGIPLPRAEWKGRTGYKKHRTHRLKDSLEQDSLLEETESQKGLIENSMHSNIINSVRVPHLASIFTGQEKQFKSI